MELKKSPGFSFADELSDEEEKFILEKVKAEGRLRHYSGREKPNEENYIFRSHACTYVAGFTGSSDEPVAYSLYEDEQEKIIWKKPGGDLANLSLYYNRYHRGLKWEFHSDPLSKLVYKKISAYVESGFLRKPTQVEVLLQRPGMPLIPHVDLEMPGHQAEIQKQQAYFGLRIPLSEGNDNGFAIISTHSELQVQGEPKRFNRYATNRKFFCLNESYVHGSLPVNFWRGVIFISGELNLNAAAGHRPLPFNILDTGSFNERYEWLSEKN